MPDIGGKLDFLPENCRTGVILRVFEQKTRRKSHQTGKNSPRIENNRSKTTCEQIPPATIRINFMHMLIFQSFAFFGWRSQTPNSRDAGQEIPGWLPKKHANETAQC
jgi:hypothetical protein